VTYYILRGHTPVACDLMTWAQWFERNPAERIVARTRVGDVTVSTVFLGVNYNYLDIGPPILFETMIFREDHAVSTETMLPGHFYDRQERYPTWDLAIKGHEAIVKELRAARAAWKRAIAQTVKTPDR
jgi:hypothetical protein